MKKLENIPKKQVFEVPDGYFEELPAKIQARISTEKPGHETAFVFRYKLQYALPLALIVAIGLYWYNNLGQPADIDSLLASVQTDDLVVYLAESELTTEDLLDAVDFNSGDLDDIESEIYHLDLGSEALEKALDDIDI